MGKAIGIDLGTTNSVAAFKEAAVEVVKVNSNTPPDRKLTRSVVAYGQNGLSVGDGAYFQLRADPENVVVSVKRLMGRGFNDPAVQKQKSEFNYKIGQPTQGTENGLALWLGGKEYQPEDISAEILKQVVQNAYAYRQEIGKPHDVINQAVITIPAYFNDKQRHATRTAALRAGLTPLELLPEPTAAAISYGYTPNEGDVKTILVYDFGGGTFDASVITAAGTSFIEAGKAGDLWLGGDDVDTRIIQGIKAQVAQEENLSDIDGLIAQMPHYQKIRLNAALKVAAETAKIELSNSTVAEINLAGTPLLDELGIAIPIEVKLTREQLEPMLLPLVERTIQICLKALQDSEYPPDSIDVVLMVGGSSQIPLVQRKVKEAFGADKVVVHPRPMYAVAEGAAIVAAGLIDKVGTVSRDYFIQLVDSQQKVISRGEILPVHNLHIFKTVVDGQRLIHFKFFSPDQVSLDIDQLERHETIGEMWLGLDQSYPRGTEIVVNLDLDEQNGDLQTTATLKNDPSIKVECLFSRGRSDEKIYQELEEVIEDLNAQNLTQFGVEEALKLAVPVVQTTNKVMNKGEERLDILDRAKAALQTLKVSMSKEQLDSEYLINESEQLIKLCGFMIPQAQQTRLEKLSQQLQDARNANDLSRMQATNEAIGQELSNLPDEVSLVRGCLLAIRQANRVAPTQASAMADKLFRMISSLEDQNGREAGRLWEELKPEVSHWIDQDSPSSTIVTGLTR